MAENTFDQMTRYESFVTSKAANGSRSFGWVSRFKPKAMTGVEPDLVAIGTAPELAIEHVQPGRAAYHMGASGGTAVSPLAVALLAACKCGSCCARSVSDRESDTNNRCIMGVR
ncbi:MAG: hypothetical protein ABIP94_08755 [Planctomycetota bacterium]